MRRFTILVGMGEAELVADPDGILVRVEDVQRIHRRLENAVQTWEDEFECSLHVLRFLKGVVEDLS